MASIYPAILRRRYKGELYKSCLALAISQLHALLAVAHDEGLLCTSLLIGLLLENARMTDVVQGPAHAVLHARTHDKCQALTYCLI